MIRFILRHVPHASLRSTRMGKSITTTTIKDDVYAFIFNQQGLMAASACRDRKRW